MNSNVTLHRHKYIGGSDIPIIMGISPFKSRFDLLLEKAELKESDFDGNEYTEYGNVLEPKIRDYINSGLEDVFVEDTIIKENLRGNFDGISDVAVLEIKTTSQIKKTVKGYKNYLVQLLFYMQLAEKELGLLAVYERPSDFNEEFDAERLTTFPIDINDYQELLAEINHAVESFRTDLIKIKSNPLLTEEELQSNELVSISDKLVKFELALAEYDEIKKQRDEMKEKLKALMEQEGVKKWTTNNGTQITLIPEGVDSTVETFDEKAFKTENEEVYKKYLVEKTKKGRKGYVKITIPKEV